MEYRKTEVTSWRADTNMWWFPLIMFTSPTFPIILFVCIGLSEAAPRIISNNAFSIVRNNREVSDTVLGRLNSSDRTYLSDANSGRFRFSGLTPAPTILSTGSSSSHVARTTVTTVEPPTTDLTTPSVSVTQTVGELPAVFDRQISGRRSADSVPFLAPQSKTLQKSQGNSERSPLIPASENSQGECSCLRSPPSTKRHLYCKQNETTPLIQPHLYV